LDLSQVYREHYRSLVRFLYRRIGDPARAEDLAQEAFVRALEHRPSRPRAWLFTVATNLARDEGRRAAVRRRHLTLIKAEADARPPEPPPDLALERRERVQQVRVALARLAERDREALLLWEEGFSYDEIAEVLGLSRGSIGTTLARARTRLAAAFEETMSKDEGSEEDVAP
jgi:RNA polymerase sigma-70 factor (ECF subfamily)